MLLLGSFFSYPYSWLVTLALILSSAVYGFIQWQKGAGFVKSEQIRGSKSRMPAIPTASSVPQCAVCEQPTSTRCSRCKSVHYCGQAHQALHWKQGHKEECRPPQQGGTKKSLGNGWLESSTVKGAVKGETQIPESRSVEDSGLEKPQKLLFSYQDFLHLFQWPGLDKAPVGLLNCGNSCYANSVLQCLTFTRPLAAYLLEGGHAAACEREGWCFVCELQGHVSCYWRSSMPFSPVRIVAQVRNIGNHLGFGRQEDAHEFVRFAVDSMQTVFLDQAGGEKKIDSASQETTLVHHIFGGQLQSQVKCMECLHESNRYESVLDLAVEIHGAVESLEGALSKFTQPEWLDGENKYKCSKCNAYVRARKRLAVHQAPNILTIALKRFQTGRFGKLNKRVTFPEVLDMAPYMSDRGDKPPPYQLYAVLVHLDMLNSTFFGHYLCYLRDAHDRWYKVDDDEVSETSLAKVLSQNAYMLFYQRTSPKDPPEVQPRVLIKPAQAHTSPQANGGGNPSISSFQLPDSPDTSTDSGSPMSEDEPAVREQVEVRQSTSGGHVNGGGSGECLEGRFVHKELLNTSDVDSMPAVLDMHAREGGFDREALPGQAQLWHEMQESDEPVASASEEPGEPVIEQRVDSAGTPGRLQSSNTEEESNLEPVSEAAEVVRKNPNEDKAAVKPVQGTSVSDSQPLSPVRLAKEEEGEARPGPEPTPAASSAKARRKLRRKQQAANRHRSAVLEDWAQHPSPSLEEAPQVAAASESPVLEELLFDPSTEGLDGLLIAHSSSHEDALLTDNHCDERPSTTSPRQTARRKRRSPSNGVASSEQPAALGSSGSPLQQGGSQAEQLDELALLLKLRPMQTELFGIGECMEAAEFGSLTREVGVGEVLLESRGEGADNKMCPSPAFEGMDLESEEPLQVHRSSNGAEGLFDLDEEEGGMQERSMAQQHDVSVRVLPGIELAGTPLGALDNRSDVVKAAEPVKGGAQKIPSGLARGFFGAPNRPTKKASTEAERANGDGGAKGQKGPAVTSNGGSYADEGEVGFERSQVLRKTLESVAEPRQSSPQLGNAVELGLSDGQGLTRGKKADAQSLIRKLKSKSSEGRGGQKQGRNELCVCGSGKKWKKCCGT